MRYTLKPITPKFTVAQALKEWDLQMPTILLGTNDGNDGEAALVSEEVLWAVVFGATGMPLPDVISLQREYDAEFELLQRRYDAIGDNADALADLYDVTGDRLADIYDEYMSAFEDMLSWLDEVNAQEDAREAYKDAMIRDEDFDGFDGMYDDGEYSPEDRAIARANLAANGFSVRGF